MTEDLKAEGRTSWLPGTPGEELMAISTLLPENGMDRRLLEQVLPAHHRQAMLDLICAGLLREDRLHRIRVLETTSGLPRNSPDVCEAFLEALWQWQQNHDEGLCFRQIRDCFCRAAELLEDRDGSISFRAAELMKESGELERASELYEQVLTRVIQSDCGDLLALARGHYCRGIALGYRWLRSSGEHAEAGMREAVRHFHQAMLFGQEGGGLGERETVQILWALAYGYAYLGQMTQTEEYCQEILKIQESLPEIHPDRVETCIQFSQLCREYGKRADCQKWLLRAAELLEKTPASEEMGWMYGLVACNCWKLPNEKRLELYQKEEQYSRRRFSRNPRDEYQWHWQVAQLQARMGNIPEAVRHKEEIPSDGESSGNWDEIQALLSRETPDQ